MSDADTIEHERAPAASQSTALVVIPAAQLPTIMAADGAADILAKLVAEADRREADVAHRKRINREAALDLMQFVQMPGGEALSRELAQAIVVAIAKRCVRHVGITY